MVHHFIMPVESAEPSALLIAVQIMREEIEKLEARIKALEDA